MVIYFFKRGYYHRSSVVLLQGICYMITLSISDHSTSFRIILFKCSKATIPRVMNNAGMCSVVLRHLSNASFGDCPNCPVITDLLHPTSSSREGFFAYVYVSSLYKAARSARTSNVLEPGPPPQQVDRVLRQEGMLMLSQILRKQANDRKRSSRNARDRKKKQTSQAGLLFSHREEQSHGLKRQGEWRFLGTMTSSQWRCALAVRASWPGDATT